MRMSDLDPAHEVALDNIALDVFFSLPDSGEGKQAETIRTLWDARKTGVLIHDEDIHRAIKEARKTF